jgi:hypothetical protein
MKLSGPESYHLPISKIQCLALNLMIALVWKIGYSGFCCLHCFNAANWYDLSVKLYFVPLEHHLLLCPDD